MNLSNRFKIGSAVTLATLAVCYVGVRAEFNLWKQHPNQATLHAVEPAASRSGESDSECANPCAAEAVAANLKH